MDARLTTYASREAASHAVAEYAAHALAADISERGQASIFVSGGSTPKQAFEILSDTPLNWSKVVAGLVDERWVPPDDAESNERLVRRHLLKSHAGAAGLLPMWTPSVDAGLAAAGRDFAYRPHCASPAFVFLGMGTDGHTASWFPGMPVLDAVLSPGDGRCVMAVEATGAVVPHRLTLTGHAVRGAKHAALLIFGREKREVLEAAMTSDARTHPVRFAIDSLGGRLRIMWAE